MQARFTQLLESISRCTLNLINFVCGTLVSSQKSVIGECDVLKNVSYVPIRDTIATIL